MLLHLKSFFSAFKIRFLIALICIIGFVCMENPSILAKMAHTNTQTFFIGKTLVLIFAEILLCLSLLFISMSHFVVRISVIILIGFSTIVFDVYYLASGKVIEYQEFLILFQNVQTNFFDSIQMYAGFILSSAVRFLLLAVGLLIMPPPPEAEDSQSILEWNFWNSWLILPYSTRYSDLYLTTGTSNK